MKSVFKKLIVIAAIVAVLGAGALIDLGVSKAYKIEFVSVARLDENGQPVADGEIPAACGIADGSTVVQFVVRLTRHGKPVSGHTLYVRTNRNVLERTDTDAEGQVVIHYRCYRGGAVSPVVLTVRDEDNSVFVFVPAEASYTLPMVKGEAEEGSGMTTDDIFYDID